MKLFLRAVLLLCLVLTGGQIYAASIILNGRDAVVWLPAQKITGKVSGLLTRKVTVYCNNAPYKTDVSSDGNFTAAIALKSRQNIIWAVVKNGNKIIRTCRLNLIMGYQPLPDVQPVAKVYNSKILLSVVTIDDPLKKSYKYFWSPEKSNPANCVIANWTTKTASVTIPLINGKYYFDLLVVSGKDSARFKTYIIRSNDQLHGYDTNKDHAAWLDSAIIYEITPGSFVSKGTYDDITNKLPEIRGEGINTIWLQPVYKTSRRGQGYDVTDYFNLRDDFGTGEQLKKLIGTAKKLNMRVLFDFVPNHTSINHPYAQDCIQNGKNSHYYNFYQHVNDGNRYSSFYKKDSSGFYAYFWNNLVNLDYNNKEVQQWIIQATKYWIKKYDIDGYRFDAIWGLNARSPSFSRRLATELKSIKPDILLLGEDKPYKIQNDGFDAAYDWTTDTAWVSQWAWQTKYNARKSLTIFNLPDTLKRCSLLRKVLFNNQDGAITTLKFMENNDVPRFIASHDLAMTKLAAGLLFSLPGLPMLYNGQEVGCKLHPYSNKPVFDRSHTIQSVDSLHLLSYYKTLIRLRLAHPALSSTKMNEAPVADDRYLLAINRWKADEHFIIVFNLGSSPENAVITVNSGIKLAASGGFTYAVDLLTDTRFEINQNHLKVQVPVDGYGIRWLLLK
jgi:glycosidase